MPNGKHVACVFHTDEGPAQHMVNRTLCLTESRGEICRTCPNSRFKLLFQLRVGDQSVACPRWESEGQRKEGMDPVDYVPVRRDTCINEHPFPFCSSCPNSDPSKMAMMLPRWVERVEKQKKLERELDDEERE